MKKNYLIIAFLFCSIMFGQAIDFNNGAADGGLWTSPTNWSTGAIPVAGNTVRTLNAATSFVNANFTIFRLQNLAGTTGLRIVNSSSGGVLRIDTNTDTDGVIAIQNTSNSGVKLGLRGRINIQNTFPARFSRITNYADATTGNAANSIEFESTSVLTITTPLEILKNADVKGANNYFFNGKIEGAANLRIAANTTATFGNSVSNTGYTGEIVLLAGASIIVNTADNVVFYDGPKIQVNGTTAAASTTLNGENVFKGGISVIGGQTFNFNVNKNQNSMKAITLGALSKINMAVDPTVTAIAFAKQSNTWATGTLNITGFQPGVIRFGTDNTGLTSTQLLQITADGVAAGGQPLGLDANGYLVLASTLTTWTGTTSTDWTDASNWSNGVPNSASNVTIGTGTFSPTIATNVNINTLAILSGATLGVTANNLTVTGAITNNGTMTLANNANLIQAGTTNNNTGAITVNRNGSQLLLFDFTLWSSPVAGQSLTAFSPLTSQSPSRFYTFDTTFNTGGVNGQYKEIALPSLATTNFAAGAGYLIRMPNTASASTPTAFAGVFTGVPNNGTIPVALVDGAAIGLRYNLVGNPYPSPISIATLVADNSANIETTLYFWRKTNGATGSAYCTYNTAGSPLFTTNGNLQASDPLGVIQTGQGFFVEAKAGATSLTFNNGQRLANNAGQFFKTKQVAAPSRIWLNATNTMGAFSQMALNYADGATLGVDDYDSKYINDSPFALTSNINNGEFTIQGRPAFDASDVVALNFKTDAAGDYTIALDHFDGVFATGQDIYLLDSKTGAETNLKTGSYTFNAVAGVDNSRFSLKYQKTLKVEAPTLDENSISVYATDGTLYVNSRSVAISNIKVFDVQGRLLTEQKNVKATTAVISNLRASQQMLIVTIVGEDNSVITKKVVN